MEELLRTNDMVLISFAESLLGEAGIRTLVFDQNMSVIEGSLGILPRRMLVPADRIDEARRLLSEAGIGSELHAPPAGRLMAAEGAAAGRTVDAFLGGRVELVQPAGGHHRAGLDAVLLAAALPSPATGEAVDLGAGAGAAGFCAAARCPGLSVTLVERDPELAECARQALGRPANQAFAGRVRVAEVDIAAPEEVRRAAGLVRAGAGIVLMNPPFFTAGAVRVSPAGGRAAAHVLGKAGLDPWFRAAAYALRPKGVLVAILAAPALPDLFAAVAPRFGRLRLLPVHPRPDAPAIRILVTAVPGSRAGVEILPGLPLHGPTGTAFLPGIAAMLRDGRGLAEVHPAWQAAFPAPFSGRTDARQPEENWQ